ncbi:MAG: hypothetical protein H5T92_02330 [Synergistales bacterium]|nr:hypothetical protein [Synergistales bacterium]
MRAFIPLTTSNGVNLLGGNNPESDGGYVFSGPYVLPNMSESDSDREYTRRAMDWIRSNPASFAKLLPSKAARFLWPLSLGTSGYIVVPRTISVLVLSITLAFYGFAVFGMWQLAVKKRFWETALLLTPFVSLSLISLLTFGASRFSLPAFPTLAVLASLGLEGLSPKFRPKFGI